MLSCTEGLVSYMGRRQPLTTARRALVPQIAAAGMDSYSRAYSSLVRLQVLQELQTAAPLLLAIRTARGERQQLAATQLETMVCAPLHARDARRACHASAHPRPPPTHPPDVCVCVRRRGDAPGAAHLGL